uniref:exodeoxyribonuclease III n=1 Tax=Pygocentrus nattereri TaxID=42514 RepID=A0A3B4D1Q7_PYGNA
MLYGYSTIMVLSLKIISWNISGISSPAKRTKVLNRLNSLESCFIQETHLTESESPTLTAKWIGQTYHSVCNLKKCGTSILIRKDISFISSYILTDPEGHYVIINGTIGKDTLTLVNIYGPNSESPAFFHSLVSETSKFSDSAFIIGGDFNTVLNPRIDRSISAQCDINNNSTTLLKQYMSDYGLVGIWRLQNPSSKEYSYYSLFRKSYSHIDYFLSKNSIAHRIIHSDNNSI